jgi:hypothetical protein
MYSELRGSTTFRDENSSAGLPLLYPLTGIQEEKEIRSSVEERRQW